MSTPALSLKDRLERARDTALAAKNFHEVWDFYKRERASIIGVMREFEDFFARDLQAHFFAFVVTIYLLQDGQGAVRFTDLFDLVAADLAQRGCSPDRQAMLDEARSIVDQNKATAAKFRLLRSNVVAHTNKQKLPGDWFKEVSLVYDEVGEYTNAMLKVSNLLLDALDPPAFAGLGSRAASPHASVLPDVRKLFETVARGLEAGS